MLSWCRGDAVYFNFSDEVGWQTYGFVKFLLHQPINTIDVYPKITTQYNSVARYINFVILILFTSYKHMVRLSDLTYFRAAILLDHKDIYSSHQLCATSLSF